MFAIELDRENLEYDVHSLVQAFYPGEQVRVLIPESSGEKRRELESKVRIRVTLEGTRAKLFFDGTEFIWELPDLQTEKGDRTGRADGQNREEKRFKEGFKAFLYQVLCQKTGRKLPWGSLTGIRPTKIAYQMLEEGKQDHEIIEYYGDKYFVSREKAELSVDIAKREKNLLADVLPAAGRCGDSYSLYIGIPFCPTTCLYCSFTSFSIAGYGKMVDEYLDCLIKETVCAAQLSAGKRLDCVYIGGGTPTTLSADQLDRLLAALKQKIDFSCVREFTVEAGRADSITEEKLQVLRRYGVDRISVNPQTMNQKTLDLIGRKASVEQVKEAYALARKAGFDNINMDLILGLPGEGEADVRRTVEQVVELAPDSLTVHSLAVKRASRLSRMIQEEGMPMLCNTEKTMGLAAEGAHRLGLKPYYLYRQKNMSGNFENVGYAREGMYGLYNILIMEEKQSIVACGAGSISKRVYPDGRIERSENVKDVSQYIERIGEMIERKRVLLED